MSTLNIAPIENALVQKINSNTSNLDLLTYARTVQLLRNGSVQVVPTGLDLPAPSATANGRLYFVLNSQSLLFNTGTDWDFVANNIIAYPREIWGWGLNSAGQLGDGTTVIKCSPVREITSSCDWCSLGQSAGSTFAAIKTTGQLWLWGSGANGILGDGTTTNKCSPVRERCSATDWCTVSTGATHAAAIKTTGQLWAWGSGANGRLGDGTTTSKCSPVREVSASTDWCQVSASVITAAIKTTGQLWTWGAATAGVLGDGTTTAKSSPVRERSSSTDWCSVSGGNSVSALKTTGQLWSWGCAVGGMLADGTTVNKSSPVREVSSATNWCDVSVGLFTGGAITTAGGAWAWGAGNVGQLGDGTTVNKSSPVREVSSSTDWCRISLSSGAAATAVFAHASKTTGQIWGWGVNNCGQIGDGTTVNKSSPVREVSSATTWCDVAASTCGSAAIKTAFI